MELRSFHVDISESAVPPPATYSGISVPLCASAMWTRNRHRHGGLLVPLAGSGTSSLRIPRLARFSASGTSPQTRADIDELWNSLVLRHLRARTAVALAPQTGMAYVSATHDDLLPHWLKEELRCGEEAARRLSMFRSERPVHMVVLGLRSAVAWVLNNVEERLFNVIRGQTSAHTIDAITEVCGTAAFRYGAMPRIQILLPIPAEGDSDDRAAYPGWMVAFVPSKPESLESTHDVSLQVGAWLTDCEEWARPSKDKPGAWVADFVESLRSRSIDAAAKCQLPTSV